MADELDQHPSLREHLGLRERVTVLEGGQSNIIQALNRIESRQLTLSASPPPQETAMALATHRALDALQKQQGGAHPLLLFLSGLGLLALGAVVACVAWVVIT